jgi:hypothetical protein
MEVKGKYNKLHNIQQYGILLDNDERNKMTGEDPS